jgi:hypothetical protein
MAHSHQGLTWSCESIDKRLVAFEQENAQLKSHLETQKMLLAQCDNENRCLHDANTKLETVLRVAQRLVHGPELPYFPNKRKEDLREACKPFDGNELGRDPERSS